MNSQAYICCKICGNRWPGGFEPKVVGPANRNTRAREKPEFDSPSPVIRTDIDQSGSTIEESKQTLDRKSDQPGGSIMREKTGSKLIDLNSHLFAQLERLSDEDLKGEKLQAEISRSHAIANVAKQIICNGNLVLHAHKAVTEGSIRGGHKMLGITEEE